METESTAQGTGLGLSLSYDIIKAHGNKNGNEGRRIFRIYYIITIIIYIKKLLAF